MNGSLYIRSTNNLQTRQKSAQGGEEKIGHEPSEPPSLNSETLWGGHSHRAKIWDSPPFGLELEKLLGRKFLSKLLRCSAISFYMTRLVNVSLVIKRMCLMHSGSLGV